jgi:hypothetical protein
LSGAIETYAHRVAMEKRLFTHTSLSNLSVFGAPKAMRRLFWYSCSMENVDIPTNAILQDVPAKNAALAGSLVDTGNDAMVSLEGLWISR